MPVEITIKGSLKQGLTQTLLKIKPKLDNGLINAGNWLLVESFPEVPVDTGSLARSGRVRAALDETGPFAEVFVGYGILGLEFPILARTSRKEAGGIQIKRPFIYAEIQHRKGYKAGWLTRLLAERLSTVASMFRQGLHLQQVEPKWTFKMQPVIPEAKEKVSRTQTAETDFKGGVELRNIPQGGSGSSSGSRRGSTVNTKE
jgi:hypothetical protein